MPKLWTFAEVVQDVRRGGKNFIYSYACPACNKRTEVRHDHVLSVNAYGGRCESCVATGKPVPPPPSPVNPWADSPALLEWTISVSDTGGPASTGLYVVRVTAARTEGHERYTHPDYYAARVYRLRDGDFTSEHEAQGRSINDAASAAISWLVKQSVIPF